MTGLSGLAWGSVGFSASLRRRFSSFFFFLASSFLTLFELIIGFGQWLVLLSGGYAIMRPPTAVWEQIRRPRLREQPFELPGKRLPVALAEGWRPAAYRRRSRAARP